MNNVTTMPMKYDRTSGIYNLLNIICSGCHWVSWFKQVSIWDCVFIQSPKNGGGWGGGQTPICIVSSSLHFLSGLRTMQNITGRHNKTKKTIDIIKMHYDRCIINRCIIYYFIISMVKTITIHVVVWFVLPPSGQDLYY